MTEQEPTLPDDLNPVVVDALAKLIGKITGLVPPPANYFPPEWHGALRDFYQTVKDTAAANIDQDGQQNFFGAAPGMPKPDYIDLEGLRDKLLAPREIARDKDGWLIHPAFPACDEDVRADKFLDAFGIESSFVAMDGDADQTIVDRYFEEGDANCADWTPTPPEGDGWMLLEIYDTEDGPYALFGRRKVEETNRERRARENAESLAADVSADRHFIAGVKLGWNFRDANDEKGFQACIEGRSAQIRQAIAADPTGDDLA